MEFATKAIEHLRLIHFAITASLIILIITVLYDQDKLLDGALKEIEVIEKIAKQGETVSKLYKSAVIASIKQHKNIKILTKKNEIILNNIRFELNYKNNGLIGLDQIEWSNNIGKIRTSSISKSKLNDLKEVNDSSFTSLNEFQLFWDASRSIKYFDAIINTETQVTNNFFIDINNSQHNKFFSINRSYICGQTKHKNYHQAENEPPQFKEFLALEEPYEYQMLFGTYIYNYTQKDCISSNPPISGYHTEIFLPFKGTELFGTELFGTELIGINNLNFPQNSPINPKETSKHLMLLIKNNTVALELDIQQDIINKTSTYSKLIKGDFSTTFPYLTKILKKYPDIEFDKMAITFKKGQSPLKSLVNAIKVSQSSSVNVFNISAPKEIISPWGPLLILIMLIYFSLHLKQYTSKFANKPIESISWIGIYKDYVLSKLIVLFSLTFLPMIATIIIFFYSPIKGHLIEENENIVFVILLIIVFSGLLNWSFHSSINKKSKIVVLIIILMMSLIYSYYLQVPSNESDHLIKLLLFSCISYISIDIGFLFNKCWSKITFQTL